MRLRHALALTLLPILSACTADRVTAPMETSTIRNPVSDPTPGSITLEKIGEYAGGGAGAAEISAFDHVSKRLFVTNSDQGTVDVLDLSDTSSPARIGTLATAQLGAAVTSVATDRGVVAVAIVASPRTSPGTVAFYRATTLQLISSVPVGALPDMLTFTGDGRRVLVANEGEPSDDYLTDPEGSVSIIDVTNVNAPTVRTAGFGAYNGQEGQLRAAGIRIFGPGASAAQDFEPEYIAIDEADRYAYVTLQENNALAIVDIAAAAVTKVVPLGYKRHDLPGNGLDASDRDGIVNIRTWPVLGMYQPDAIAAYSVGGQTWLVTANEGDARDYAGFAEESRVNALALNPAIFTDAVCGGSCTGNTRLGRLTVTTTLGQNPETGEFDALYAFGGRSFSIWSSAGQLVWDSGDQFEQRTTALPQAMFNASNVGNAFDDRSDNKGPEPEGVTVGRLGQKVFAFIGLERVGGVMVYDVTNPSSPRFVTYASSRSGAGGDLGPEGLVFVPAMQSPSKEPLLIASHEVSGTVAVFRINLQ